MVDEVGVSHVVVFCEHVSGLSAYIFNFIAHLNVLIESTVCCSMAEAGAPSEVTIVEDVASISNRHCCTCHSIIELAS